MRSLVRAVGKRPALLVGLAAVSHLMGLHALDALGIMDRLLSPSGPAALVWAVVGAAFLGLRLLLILVGPGLILADLAWWAGQFIVRRQPPRG